MSTVAEIEAAIEQLSPEEFRALKEWFVLRAESAAGGRMWMAEELAAAAQRMVDEADPVKAEALKEQILRGFYGDADA